MIDSYYEYLIKMVALLGDDKGIYSTMYQRAVKVGSDCALKIIL